MKLLLVSAAALALSVTAPAFAKDLTPAAGAAPMGWGGGFVGIHGGYGSADRSGCGDIGIDLLTYALLPDPAPIVSCDTADPEFTFDYGQTGGLFGIQGGYNWTFSESFLIGLEASASITGMSGDLDTNGNGDPSLFGGVGKWDNMLTATAKAGFTAGNVLFYGEGGYAVANARFSGDLGCDFTMTHSGPVAGVGMSVKVSDQASLDFKYDHIWLGAEQASCNSTATAINPAFLNVPTQLLSQGTVDVVKVGLNFHMGQ